MTWTSPTMANRPSSGFANAAYDCILMDIRMPKMSGVDAFKEIKKLSPATPVILMTAYSVQDLIDEALAEGVFAVIHKPVSIDRVLAMIEELRGKSSVLIVDRQTDLQLVDTLTGKGYRVAVVDNAVDAIEKVSTQLFDVVLLSAEIAGLYSEEALVLMKECNPKCIIVLMSSQPDSVPKARSSIPVCKSHSRSNRSWILSIAFVHGRLRIILASRFLRHIVSGYR